MQGLPFRKASGGVIGIAEEQQPAVPREPFDLLFCQLKAIRFGQRDLCDGCPGFPQRKGILGKAGDEQRCAPGPQATWPPGKKRGKVRS